MRHRGQVQNLVAATITHLQSRVTRSASSSKRFRDLDATPREVCSFHPPETVRFTPGVDTYPATVAARGAVDGTVAPNERQHTSDDLGE